MNKLNLKKERKNQRKRKKQASKLEDRQEVKKKERKNEERKKERINTCAEISRNLYIATMHSMQCIVSTKIFFKKVLVAY